METWFWVLGWSLSILTVTGNGFVIILVLRKRQLRTKTNAFVVSLAVADFCVGMIAVPSLFFCEMSSGCNSKALLADGIDYIRWLFVYASAANLCSLVLDRYIAVVKPLKYLTFMKRRRIVRMISLSWAIPVTFIVLVSSLWLSLKLPAITHIIGWLCLFLELFLCIILIFFFASMLHVVYKHTRSSSTLAKQLRFNYRVIVKAQETSAVKMMAIVISLFLLCYVIALRCSFVLIFNDHKPCNDLQYKVPILLLNSAVNPLAYAIFKKDIKKEFKRLIYFVILKKSN